MSNIIRAMVGFLALVSGVALNAQSSLTITSAATATYGTAYTATAAGGGTGSAPQYRSSSSNGVAGGGSLTINKPAGTTTDDYLIACIQTYYYDGGTITPPSGWTSLGKVRTYWYVQTAEVFVRRAGSSEPASYVFTNGGTHEIGGVILSYSGVDPTTALDATPSMGPGNSSAPPVPIVADEIITATPDSLLVWISFLDANWWDFTFSPPSGYTLRQDFYALLNTGTLEMGAADKPQAEAGATGNQTGSANAGGGTALPVKYLLALRSATPSGALVWALGSGSTAAGAAINASTGAITATGPGTVVIKAQRVGDGSVWTADYPVTVGARPLTVTGLSFNDKTYDGTTAAITAGTATLSGVVAGDSVSLSGTPTYTFASAGVGTGITVTATGYTLTGADASKYTLIQPSGTATIVPPPQSALTITSASTVTYGTSYTATATGAGSGSAPVYRSSSSNAVGSGGSVSINKPAGTAIHDYLIACIQSQQFNRTITPPAGWTSLGKINTNGYHKTSQVFIRRAGGSEPANYIFTTSGTYDFGGVILCYSNADYTAGSDVTPSTGAIANTATPLSIVAGGITTVTPNSLLVWISFLDANWWNFTFTPPSGFTLRQDFYSMVNSTLELGVADSPKAAAGATGSQTGSASAGGGDASSANFLLALRSANPSGAVVWALGSGSTAAGAAINATTGVITANSAGTVVIKAQRVGDGPVWTADYTVTVTAAATVPGLGSPVPTGGQTGATFSYQITASNSPTSYSATGLPPGLSINTTTGLISGTPTAPGTYTVTLGAANAGGNAAPVDITITILASLPYTADFESAEGYVLGSLNGQLGWTVDTGISVVSNLDFANPSQSVQLTPGNPPPVISQTFASSPGQTVEFFDIFARPVAGTPPGTASTFTIEESEYSFLLSGNQGVLQYFSGNGSGGGTWVSTAFTIPLGAGNQSTNWVRLTARLDFTQQKWDLYANAQMVAADIPFISSSTYLSSFQLQGDVVAASGLDYLYAGPTNPLFADTNANGIDDTWETAHGLSLATNNRNTSPTGNGVTVIQAYVGGTNPNDFYNGTTPQLSIVSGNNQVGAAGQFNVQPFLVSVKNAAGVALVNAPVTFMVQSGGGQLASSNIGTPVLSTSITLTTDSNGTVQVYYRQPVTVSQQSVITVAAGNNSNSFSTSSAAIGDTDGNGLADSWELEYFGGTGIDPNADPDGDGLTNLQEFQSGSSPTDSSNGNSNEPPARYLIQAYLAPAGYVDLEATGINDAGQVIGVCYASNFQSSYGVLVTPGQPTTILPGLGGTNTYPLALNSRGEVVGYSDIANLPNGSRPYHSFFWSPATGINDLQVGMISDNNLAVAINDAGKIAGENQATGQGYSWAAGLRTYLQPPAGFQYLHISGMNSAGNMVGEAYSSSQGWVPVVYLGGVPSLLQGDATPMAINSSNEAVGFSSGAATYWGADGTINVLPPPDGLTSQGAYSINNRGTIVGSAYDSGGNHPVLWWNSASQGVALSTRLSVEDAADWQLKRVAGINSWGQIAGSGKYRGQQAAFVMTPVPKFIKLYDKFNKANRIYNSSRKDDPWDDGAENGASRNTVYVVAENAQDTYKVIAEFTPPSTAESKFLVAAFLGSTKIQNSDSVIMPDGKCEVSIKHTGFDDMADFVIRMGYDANNSGTIDPSEIIQLAVESYGEPTVRGINNSEYDGSKSQIDDTISGAIITGTNFLFPHARQFLRLFRDGYIPGEFPSDKAPSTTGAFEFNAFNGYLSEWLTHNAGAEFSDEGVATIPFFTWIPSTSAANLVATAPQIEDPVRAYYYAVVRPLAEVEFADLLPNSVRYYPSPNDFADVPRDPEPNTPPWVPATTVTFDGIPIVPDDVNGTIGRGRLLTHQAQYRVKKEETLVTDSEGNSTTILELKVTQVISKGSVEDLYDFSVMFAGALGSNRSAAIIQLGYAKGTHGPTRNRGKIYKHQINFNKTYPTLP